jgi:SAM-dependent methyltransferase
LSAFAYRTAIAALSLLAIAAAAIWALRLAVKIQRGDLTARQRLWEWFYSFDWGDVTVNNFGFAPAEREGPEKYQHQMYAELAKPLAARKERLERPIDLLEVSCGRGGGLARLVRDWPGPVRAVGLDLAGNAIAACRRSFGAETGLSFVQGSALALPFPDESFDVVLNVEASNDYGDRARFFREVHRVLRPAGMFLYADTRPAGQFAATEALLRDSGFDPEMRDITASVVEACRADTPRRLDHIRRQLPWPYRLAFGQTLRCYAAVEGTPTYELFRTRQRLYLMAAASKRALSTGSFQAASGRIPD